jgi:hypothetical protein
MASNEALHRMAAGRRGCSRRASWPPSLSSYIGSFAQDLIAPRVPEAYSRDMKVQEIEREALELSEGERAKLVASLIDTLGPPGAEVSDDEVEQRDVELEKGVVQPVVHEEFVRRVQEERGR